MNTLRSQDRSISIDIHTSKPAPNNKILIN